ncbi:TPA: hypothetical protein MJD79_25250 [Klebsiella pneumoniae]|nr:hypothetical protein [Klebsiella pneumoniae]
MEAPDEVTCVCGVKWRRKPDVAGYRTINSARLPPVLVSSTPLSRPFGRGVVKDTPVRRWFDRQVLRDVVIYGSVSYLPNLA